MATAIDEAARQGTPVAEALGRAGRNRGIEIGNAATGSGTPLQIATEALGRFGYEPRNEDDGLVMANCPFHALARTHTQLVCEMNLALLDGLCERIGGLTAAPSARRTLLRRAGTDRMHRTGPIVSGLSGLDPRQGSVARILVAWGQLKDKENVMLINRIAALLAVLRPVTVQAHCDTAEGPAVKDGLKALEEGNVNYALKWIPVDGEAELRGVYEKALMVRTLGVEAAELADRLFLETLVRIHRMGEGVGFTGIQPVGTQIDPVVTAADEAIAVGSDADLAPMVPQERRAELDKRFRAALAIRDFNVDDVAAGRRYIAAYVSFFKYAEGEDHAHHAQAGHSHEH
ncbi:MAG: hypothetical protein IT193_07885 [Propionibacteriaceae bacterium]|nr:hypothetical protein [Propionibacteriaceae bacterium]